LKGCKTPGCKTELSIDSVPEERHRVLLAMTGEELEAAKQTQCRAHRAEACQQFLFQILQQNPGALVPFSEVHQRGLKEYKFSRTEIQLASLETPAARADIVGGTMYLWIEGPETKIKMEELLRYTKMSTTTTQRYDFLVSKVVLSQAENDKLVRRRFLW
jgi:hypothetical protein